MHITVSANKCRRGSVVDAASQSPRRSLREKRLSIHLRRAVAAPAFRWMNERPATICRPSQQRLRTWRSRQMAVSVASSPQAARCGRVSTIGMVCQASCVGHCADSGNFSVGARSAAALPCCGLDNTTNRCRPSARSRFAPDCNEIADRLACGRRRSAQSGVGLGSDRRLCRRDRAGSRAAGRDRLW